MTAPFRGIRTSRLVVGSGVPAAATFYESLADADDAALMRLCKHKTSKMVTFGHHNAKGDLRTPQNRLFLFSVEDPHRDGLMEVDISSGSLEIWKMFVPLSHH